MGFDTTAVFWTFFIYALLAVSYFGWGKLFFVMPGLKGFSPDSWPVTFYIWLGWCVTLFLFQIIHFVLPLKFYPVAVVFGIGVLLSAGCLISGWNSSFIKVLLRNPGTVSAIVLVSLILSTWIALRAMLPPIAYDSGLYHLNSVRWINSYPIVPGLGNLHGRLAFNQSFFAYVAALNFHPIFGHGRCIANSFLLILTAATMMELLANAFIQPVHEMQADLFKWVPALFSLPILVYFALFSKGVMSPTPDLTSNLLQVALFSMFVRAIGEFMEKKWMPRSSVFIIGVMAATSITVKLSNLVFSVVLSAIILAAALKSTEARIRETAIMLVPASIIIIVFCCRGLILSGAPLYPSTIGYFHTECSVPVEKVVDEARWVYSWARQPKAHPDNVLGNWNWLGPWMKEMGKNVTEVVFPSVFFLVLCCLNAALFIILKRTKRQYYALLFTLPPMAGLAFWFFTAPDLRFAKALFFLLPVSGIVVFLSIIRDRVKVKTFASIMLVVFVIGNYHIFKKAIKYRMTLEQVSKRGWYDIRPVPLKQLTTESGLLVYKPMKGDQCWDSPLPCTPNFDKNLRLRKPDDLSSGFSVR